MLHHSTLYEEYQGCCQFMFSELGNPRDLTLLECHLHQVSKVQYDKIWSYIESGKQQGATLALGGEKRPGKGYYVDPTSKHRSLTASWATNWHSYLQSSRISPRT